MKSRIAPTPSGYLHSGNGFNFLLTYLLVKSYHGHLHLRIDDYDKSRIRDHFIEDIFQSLEWLGIKCDTGPKNLQEFKSQFSSQKNYQQYSLALKELPKTFTCECSRKDLKENSQNNIYQGTCYEKKLQYLPQQNCIRVKWNKEPHDFIVWTKLDFPSYQLASLIDDETQKINLIIRGEDLKQSTSAQLYLASLLNKTHFKKIKFIHHPLLLSKEGEKLSKSIGSTSLKHLRQNGMKPEEFYQLFYNFFNFPIKEKLTIESMAGQIQKLYQPL